uniref:Kazal-like domain-containing protein n=1 Tax=Urocitellus parryii TaxID=9999 RepID=A0A8D2KIJ7_UROPR
TRKCGYCAVYTEHILLCFRETLPICGTNDGHTYCNKCIFSFGVVIILDFGHLNRCEIIRNCFKLNFLRNI